MKTLDWSIEKNLDLKKQQGIFFEDVLFHIQIYYTNISMEN